MVTTQCVVVVVFTAVMCLLLHWQIDLLRVRVKEKEAMIDRKARQVVSLQAEKKRIESEMNELHDHLDIKDRKASVLQRKVCS